MTDLKNLKGRSDVKMGFPIAMKSILKVMNLAMEMRRDAKSKEMIDFTKKEFLMKDYYEVHLDKYVIKRSEGAYDFGCSYEWMPSGTIMEHFSVGHKSRTLLPNEAQMVAILLGIKDNQKAIQSKKGVCHYYTPVAFKKRDDWPPKQMFGVIDTL